MINGIVEETYQRETVWQVQTPQSFKREIILKAYQLADSESFVGTDDASLVERAGFKVHVLSGDYDNIKITTTEDLVIAESIIERRGIHDV